jgi:hypothetical protein
VVIYETAFLYEGLFIRTDVLLKTGNSIKLIEVKAKSFNPNDEYNFVGARGGIVSSWKPSLFDLAFQKYLARLQTQLYLNKKKVLILFKQKR